jgi:uncharacterized protein YjbJ (UPF0337 family)
MNEGLGDKLKGGLKEGAGKIEEEWGEATNDPNAKAEGEARQVEGNADQAVGGVKRTASDVTRDVKNTVNDVTH